MDLLLLGLLALGKVVWGAVMSLGKDLLGELVIEGSGSWEEGSRRTGSYLCGWDLLGEGVIGGGEVGKKSCPIWGRKLSSESVCHYHNYHNTPCFWHRIPTLYHPEKKKLFRPKWSINMEYVGDGKQLLALGPWKAHAWIITYNPVRTPWPLSLPWRNS